MDERYSDLNVLTVMVRLTPELPELLSGIWAEVQSQVVSDLKALQNSKDSKEQEMIAERLVDVMCRSPKAQQRLNVELRIQEAVKTNLEHALDDLRSHMDTDDRTLRASLAAAVLGLHWALDPDEIPFVDEPTTMSITIKPGGVPIGSDPRDGGKSIKFRNLNLDFGEMSSIAGGALLAGHEVIKDPNGFLIAAGVLMTIAALIKAATVQINEQDASVFWGFIQTRNKKDNTATEAEIIASTHRERAKYNRSALKDKDIRQSLTNLEALKSIAPVEGHPGRWKLIERFSIRA